MSAVSVRQKQTRLTQKQADQLAEEYLDGATVKQLAQKWAANRHTVTKHLKRRGIRVRRRKMSREDVAEAARQYKAKASLEQLAKRFGVSSHTIRRELLEAGVKMRPSHHHIN